jgi:hypothetical protein
MLQFASVTVADSSADEHGERGHRLGRHAAEPRLRLNTVALLAATGILVVAATFGAGRVGYASSAWADRAYWLGQALIVVPAAAWLLSRRVLTAGLTMGLITVFTVSEYLVTICYSPAAFTYPDELSHWRTTVNILHTGRLFTPNYVLPISPHYPGLEVLTSALVSVTGLSVFTCGLIIAGVAHLLLVFLLYVLYLRIGGSFRVAGIAVLCYAANSHFYSFDSMFIYQTLALPFFALTLLAAWQLGSRRAGRQRAGWVAVSVLAIATTVVTHHVTSYMLVVALILVSIAALGTANFRTAAWTGGLALVSAGAAVAWVMLVAPSTLNYLQPFVEGILQSFRSLLGGGHASAPSTSAGPLSNRALAAAAALGISALLPFGWWRIWRNHRHRSWPVALAIMSLGWYLVVLVRFTVADGSELSGRAATFIFVPVAYVVALALGQLGGAAVRWQARAIATALLVAVLILLFNGLVNGWPPYWERLPGPYQVASFERSVAPEGIATAQWALSALGPGNRFASDFGNEPILGSYGDQAPVLAVSFLYNSPVYTSADAEQARALAIRYVLVDHRLSQSLPASGQYFPADPEAGRYRHPLAAADLTKYNHTAGVARIYDAGSIVIYDLDGGRNAP